MLLERLHSRRGKSCVATALSLCNASQDASPINPNSVEPSGVQALKNPNPLKDVEGLAVLAVAELS